MKEPLDYIPKTPLGDQEEDLAIGWKIFSFLIPIAGAIIYFNHRDTNTTKAFSAAYAGLFGLGLNILIRIMSAMM